MARLYARAIVALRWPVLVAWIAAAAVAVVELPPLSERSRGALGSVVPDEAEALAAERAGVRAFGFPLFSRTVLVRRDPDGLSTAEQERWLRTAARLTTRDRSPVEAALPLVNRPEIAPFAPEHGTTALAYLLFPPGVDPAEKAQTAQELGHGSATRATGLLPARLAVTEQIVDRLRLVEIATAVMVLLVVGLHFRAVGAPLAALALVLVSYVIAIRVLPWLAARAGVAAPREVEPMIVVLLFGALTDYAIFLLTRCRAHLARGAPRVRAARAAVRELVGIVTAAAAIVMGAASALALADFDFFRAFGPAMAVAIGIGWLVVVTLAPALLAIFGRALYLPSAVVDRERPPGGRRRRLLGFVARHPLPAIVVVGALLLAGASGLTQIAIGNPVLRNLPDGAPAREGYEALAAGFGPGVAAPTLVVAQGEGIADRRSALARLQDAIEARPGVAAVLGPADQPLPVPAGALLSRDGDTARLAVVLADDPLGANAIATVRALRDDLPQVLDRAGLPQARALVGGDTALAAETIALAVGDLALVAPAALLVVLLVLAVYLRAVAVPLLLVAASVLGLAAALGITAWVWQAWWGFEALSYYVPFAVAVLLLALGSDYSVLLVGRIWQAAADRPAADAIADAGARAARPIATAGLVLALSFALLALVPLAQFRQVAFAMALGLLLDAFLVRTLFVPALIALAARRGARPAPR